MNARDHLPLSTIRLTLRRFRDGEVDAFLGYRNDPEVIRYEYWTGCNAAEAAILRDEWVARNERTENSRNTTA